VLLSPEAEDAASDVVALSSVFAEVSAAVLKLHARKPYYFYISEDVVNII